ncbi:glycoside hydrolase [Agrocybe pediades]|nr:glycoside hydrolase [Agrocybe pediades]
MRITLLLLLFVYACYALPAKDSKRGLANADSAFSADIKKANTSTSLVSWQYNWGSSASDTLAKSGIQFIPMQWGTSGIDNFATKVKSQGAQIILGFNEPDLASQSNIDAASAAALWKKYIDPLAASGVRLGAPAVTSGPGGQVWLAAFLAACSGCTIDFIPFHWYGTGIDNFSNYVSSMHARFPNYPLWVTEFASTSSDTTEVANFMNSAIQHLDSLDWIERYSWFAYNRQQDGSFWNLLDENGSLNNMGKTYVNGA